MHLEMSVSKILAHRRLWYKQIIEMTSNMIHIVALGVGLRCPHKILLNTQWGGGQFCPPSSDGPASVLGKCKKKSLANGFLL